MRFASLATLLLLAAALPAVQANPVVPYCPGTVAPAPSALPTVSDPAVCKATTGRVFPEASSLSTPPGQLPAQDFVSFWEARAGLDYLNRTYPDYIEIHKVADSFGLCPTPAHTGACNGPRDRFPILAVEVTNEKSPIALAERQQVLFMLSIHGNEKGGREGGLRAIEDLASGMGIANEKVQDGAGLATPLDRPGGGKVETYRDYLDFMRLVFLLPNSDGWAHDELPYAVSEAGLCGTLFCRTNGNGTDLNRQLPTIGWQLINPSAGRLPVNEPEAAGYLPWMVQNYRFDYAVDIHGMLNHHNFVAIMMPAGSFTPQEMLRSTRLAETLKERLNAETHFSQWTTLLGTADGIGGQAASQVDQGPQCTAEEVCVGGSPTGEVGSGEFADWGTVWDAIGYTDSGFSGDFFAQNTGLNAPGYDIELAYNHITVDSQYEGPGALFNDYHVESVRHIVKSFMDAAGQDVRVSVETHGSKTLVLRTTYVATNLDDSKDGKERPTPGGWADRNPRDDLWQYSGERPFKATPAKYWTDLQPFLRDGDRPGVLAITDASGLSAQALEAYTNLVIPGSAIREIERDGNAIAAIKAWVEQGGNLVLTDEGMRFLDLAGITQDGVDRNLQYAGAIDLKRDHELAKGVRGFARQTFEPVPLGFSVQSNSAPTWYVEAGALEAAKGDAAGYAVRGQAGGPEPDKVTLGRIPVGAGKVQFIGALLPDPSEEFYHPYGLDDYASTYSGNQILRNMLGWEETFQAPPVVISGDGKVIESANEAPAGPAATGTATGGSDAKGTPGLLPAMALLALALAAFLRRR
jgi:hypothetical protein